KFYQVLSRCSLLMKAQTTSFNEACAEIVLEINRLKSIITRPVVVAIDGGSGAGKSTLAFILQKQTDAALVSADDFFAATIPDGEWDRFSVEERLRYVFEWQSIHDCALEPLLANKPAKWYPFDFEGGVQADRTYKRKHQPVRVDPSQVIIIEGAYCVGSELSKLFDVTVLVDVSIVERHKRLVLREDAEFLRQWHQRWDPVEAYYFSELCPMSTFDFVVSNE
ncbi:MAG: hypothetical protein AAF485_32900, partial [Chloroflexota bacterium]